MENWESSQGRTNVAVLEVGAEFSDLLHRVEVEVERGVVLMEVADFATGRQIHLPAGQPLVAVDEFQERRLPLPVAAHDADAVTLTNFQRLLVEDFSVKSFKDL